MSKFTFIDLFAGIGGFRIALSNNGGECIGFSEIDKLAITTYCENYGESLDVNLGDIVEIRALPKHDLLVGGVPCQSWSIAGKNLGFDDDRGQLWNDTIYLLKQSKPKCFIFENVKGLNDPRNAEALQYILKRIHEAGYYAKPFTLDSSDYGIPQSRVRVYIIGFQKKEHFDNFTLPKKIFPKPKLYQFLDLPKMEQASLTTERQTELFGEVLPVVHKRGRDLNNYFLFNDIRNGTSTIHSWDIIPTTQREKDICLLLLKNRRKRIYGLFDGNPLSIEHFNALDKSISCHELEILKSKGILKSVEYVYHINAIANNELSPKEMLVLNHSFEGELRIDDLKNSRKLKQSRILFKKVIKSLKAKSILTCIETRYEFRFTKISSGINGINRIYLPISEVFSTLVASGINDYVATVNITAQSHDELKQKFLEEVYFQEAYRKISKEEACAIQGFPRNFHLPSNSQKWMKLLGNSVSVPVIDKLCKAIVRTGVFDVCTMESSTNTKIYDYKDHLRSKSGQKLEGS